MTRRYTLASEAEARERVLRKALAQHLGGQPKAPGVVLSVERAQFIADELDELAALRLVLDRALKREEVKP